MFLGSIMCWLVIFISLVMMCLIFKDLSKKLGEALQIKKYYLLYDVSVGIMIVSMVLMLIEYISYVNNISMCRVGTLLPEIMFLISIVIQVATTVKYWGWIIPEILGSIKK